MFRFYCVSVGLCVAFNFEQTPPNCTPTLAIFLHTLSGHNNGANYGTVKTGGGSSVLDNSLAYSDEVRLCWCLAMMDFLDVKYKCYADNDGDDGDDGLRTQKKSKQINCDTTTL